MVFAINCILVSSKMVLQAKSQDASMILNYFGIGLKIECEHADLCRDDKRIPIRHANLKHLGWVSGYRIGYQIRFIYFDGHWNHGMVLAY